MTHFWIPGGFPIHFLEKSFFFSDPVHLTTLPCYLPTREDSRVFFFVKFMLSIKQYRSKCVFFSNFLCSEIHPVMRFGSICQWIEQKKKKQATTKVIWVKRKGSRHVYLWVWRDRAHWCARPPAFQFLLSFSLFWLGRFLLVMLSFLSPLEEILNSSPMCKLHCLNQKQKHKQTQSQ